MSAISFNVLSGILPASGPIIQSYCKNNLNKERAKKVGAFVRNYFGANFGFIAYRSIALFGDAALTGRAKLLSLAVGVAGAALTNTIKDGKDKSKVFLVQYGANVVLGLASLYCGQYAFGLSAIAASIVSITAKD